MISKLYKYAVDNAIDIDFFPMSEDTEAMSIPGAVAINPKKIKTSADFTVKLGHELGHQATGSYYLYNSKFETRARKEERAKRWAVSELLPAEDIKKAIQEGYTEAWQLAEYFNVTEDFVRNAIRIHRLKGRI